MNVEQLNHGQSELENVLAQVQSARMREWPEQIKEKLNCAESDIEEALVSVESEIKAFDLVSSLQIEDAIDQVAEAIKASSESSGVTYRRSSVILKWHICDADSVQALCDANPPRGWVNATGRRPTYNLCHKCKDVEAATRRQQACTGS